MDKPQTDREELSTDSSMGKKAFRALIRERLKHLPMEKRSLQSRELCERLARFLTEKGLERGRIATFHPFGAETDLTGLRSLLPRAHFYYPLCREGNVLTFHLADSPETDLQPGLMGLLEPVGTRPSLPPADLDAILVPGLAFTPQGDRLGKGGGYYDRTLSQTGSRPLLLGVAFPCQIVDTLPREKHDHPVDLVITADRG